MYNIKPEITPAKIRLFTLSDLINLTENGAAIINIELRKKGSANKDWNSVLCLVAANPAFCAILINPGRFQKDIVSGGAKFS